MRKNCWQFFVKRRPEDNQKCEFIMKTHFKGTFKANELEPCIVPDQDPPEQYIVKWRKIENEKKESKISKEERILKIMEDKL